MTQTANGSVENQVRKLARDHHVSADPDSMSRMAVLITRMAGDVVALDRVEQLLVNLKKKGVLSKAETLALQGRYLQERRAKKRSA